MTGIPNGFYSSEKYPEYTLEGLTEKELTTIEVIRRRTSSEFNHSCSCSNGKQLMIASFDGIVKLWEHSLEGQREIQSFHLYPGNLRYIQLSPIENTFYAGFADQTVQIWKKESGHFQKFRTLYLASGYQK